MFDDKLAALMISFFNYEGVFHMISALVRKSCRQVRVKTFYDEDTYKQVVVKIHDDSEHNWYIILSKTPLRELDMW